MLFLRTGFPGAGKTLNAIKEIDEEFQCDPENPSVRLNKDPSNPDLPPRDIYYHGIPELQIEKLGSNWIYFDTPDLWYELPDGCVIVIDEAQGTFGTDLSVKRINKVTAFETHRHHGWDIHLITQHPSLLTPPVRKLVGKHINCFRPYGKVKDVFRHEYEMCVDAPEKRVNFKMSQETKIQFDPKYYGLYKSATVHTHKKVTPRFVKMLPVYILAIVLPLAGLGGLMWWVLSDGNSMKAKSGAHSGESLPVAEKIDRNTVVKKNEKVDDREVVDFSKSRVPRVKDLELSAPRYDSLNKPRDFPKPVCMSSQDERLVSKAEERGFNVGVASGIKQTCQCYTQQATRMKTSFEFCMDVVANGYFDDTKLQPVYASGNSKTSGNTRPSVDPADALRRGPAAGAQRQGQQPTGANFTIVADSELPNRPWRRNAH